MIRRMTRAFMFDLDGTLQDSEVLWVEATDLLLREIGHPLPYSDVLSIVYGISWHDVYAALRRRIPALRMSREDMEAELSLRMQERRRERDIRIHGSVALLRRLAASHAVCVVSGSPRADVAAAIAFLEIGPCLRFHLGAEDYSPGKPDPACFLAAARRLAVPPADCVVFEDSRAGVLAAKAAGMRCVALVRDGAPAQDVSAADLRLADLNDFDPGQLDSPGARAPQPLVAPIVCK